MVSNISSSFLGIIKFIYNNNTDTLTGNISHCNNKGQNNYLKD